ncbi:MAG: CHASE2 domain-containing protein, partial [Leptolyngbya sp. SIO4C1]|nr:CHASE2 domain-containing protein [Leptolyngbya sp. SIO4C1]
SISRGSPQLIASAVAAIPAESDLPLLNGLSQFVETHLLSDSRPTVVFIDEIDSFWHLPFAVDDLFAFIRFCFNQRAVDARYQQLTIALFGVVTPATLIQHPYAPPFNIGRTIALKGFRLTEAQPLAAGLAAEPQGRQQLLRQILHWTAGQPFLTQKLCRLVKAHIDERLGSERLADWLAHLVRSHLIENWQSQDEPEHLRTIRNRLLADSRRAGRLLGIYQQILRAGSLPMNDSRDHSELLLSGLVVNQRGRLRVKNRIYRAVFSAEWVAQQLEALRPYASRFNAWRLSGQQNHLLQGEELRAALTWSLNKQLSDLDYRFLSASQALAQRRSEQILMAEQRARAEAQSTLESVRAAYAALNQAQQHAKQRRPPLAKARRWMTGLTGSVTGLIIGLRLTGQLQLTEWTALDRFFQTAPAAASDRIVLIEVNEQDLRAAGQFPLSDALLAQTIEQLNRAEPRLIGLNIYRDLPVAPGTPIFAQVVQQTPNLFGISKQVGGQIDRPLALDPGHVGFVDQVLDSDGTVRRALLSVRSQDALALSFSLMLTLAYLETEGITPADADAGLRLGQAQLVPFQPYDGAYVRADAGGYQILINYSGQAEQFLSYSLGELLASQVSPAALRDRIVIVGYQAESVNERFQTPYSTRLFGGPPLMSGSVLQANMIAQLLSAALDGRPLLRVWPEPGEYLWILLWTSGGSLIGWRFRQFATTAIAALVAVLSLLLAAYSLFLAGWWVPVIPPAIGLVTTALLLTTVASKQIEQHRLQQTVLQLKQLTRHQPELFEIAMEHLRQSALPEHQRLLSSMVEYRDPAPTVSSGWPSPGGSK